MTFGRHIGKKFETIVNTDPSYCQWVMQAVEQEPTTAPTLRRLAEYTAKVERDALQQTQSQSSNAGRTKEKRSRQESEAGTPQARPAEDRTQVAERAESPSSSDGESLRTEDFFRMVVP